MKEQWSISENNKQLADMEEGLYQERQKRIKKIEHKTNYCVRCIPYLRLIFLIEVMLFFGWGCYMLFQTYRPVEVKDEATSITLEKYPSMIESLSKIQKSRSSTEMSMIFVKPEVIDKINNLLEDMKLMKDQNLMQNKAVVTDVPNVVQTNTQNSNNVRNNNMVEISAINRLLATLSGNLMHKKFMENSVPEKFFSIHENVNTDKNDKLVHHTQFWKKLLNISKIKAADDLEKIENKNKFLKDLNCLILENHAPDVSNKHENLELDITTISNSENFADHTVSMDLINILKDPKFSDLIKNAAQDDRSPLFDETNEQVNAHLELGLVICPPYESREFLDMLIKDSAMESPTSQLLAQEILEQNGNGSNDNDEKNEDKHDINDSDMSMSASASGNQDHFDISTVTVQNIEKQFIAKIKDEKYESTENINDPYKFDFRSLWFWQPTVQDSVESLTSNVDKFEWFNVPPCYIDLGLEDTSKSSELRGSLLWDTYEKMNVDDVIPESQCEITIEMGIVKVKCPAIKFDEKWNFTSSEIPLTEIPKIANFGDVFDVYLHIMCDKDANEKLEVENISNENTDKEVTTSRNRVPKVINEIELQESTMSTKLSNDALLDLTDAASIDPFDSGEIDQNYAFYYDSLFYDSIEEEMKQVTTVPSPISEFDSSTIDLNKGQEPFLDASNIQQQEQLKINKEQDDLTSDNIGTSLKDVEHFYTLEKTLISLFKNEISNIISQYLPKSSEKSYQNGICIIFHYMRSIFQHSSAEQYVALRKLLAYIIQNSDYPHNMDDSYYRKKRMTDDLWQQDQLSNTLEEDGKDVNVLENLKKLFQKMEVLALCIDRLHERYLLHNKLDDDYASSEFPIETEERREVYTSIV